MRLAVQAAVRRRRQALRLADFSKAPMYHLGELEVQARAGVQYQAERVGKIISSAMPLAAQEFLRRQPFAVLSSVDVQGRVWVSILTGKPGFIRATDEQIVAIEGVPADHDPLRENLQANPNIGMLAIEFATRKRMRVNGKSELRDNGVVIYARQVYSNCPKYIQARDWEVTETAPLTATVQRSKVLSTAQQSWIKQADTFFIGSFHPQGGADASHRGGNPGFVKVLDEKALLWPDYVGNSMFNTLGNITAYPQAGLLFVDFDQGATLQLTGTAKVIWDTSHAVEFPGVQRLVEFQCKEVIEAQNAIPLRWAFHDYSSFNPV